jgi:hypothetical protein
MAELTEADIIRIWREDPVQFVRDNFKKPNGEPIEPDAWQTEILRAFPKNQQLAMKACKGPGKTCVLAWLIWNFLGTRPDAQVLCTSVTEDNLRDGLWKELAKWQDTSPYLMQTFEWKQTRIKSKTRPKHWWCSARTWTEKADKTKQAAALSGFHADYGLFVLDEASTIPTAVMATAEAALATGTEVKIVIAGNPELLSGPLYDACFTEREDWFVVEITGDPDDPKRSPRIDEKWARKQIKKYGRDNPIVMVNVLGQFPKASLTALLSPDQVREAMARDLKPEQYSFQEKKMGIDVARFGKDYNVLQMRQGLAAFPPVDMLNARTKVIAGRAMTDGKKAGVSQYYVDATGGYGAGVEDAMLEHVSVIGVYFNGEADDGQYYNKRAEMYWRVKEWVERGGALPPHDQLKRELSDIKYSFQRDKIRIEEKEQIRQRLGWSPDFADALALTFYHEDSAAKTPEEQLLEDVQGGNHESEYDPLEENR